jgi:prepilin-type N-terminal cleavage/methylation domain-containing protein
MKPTLSFMAAKTPAGFSLIEVAIVLFVLALLAGSILVPLSAQIEQRYYDDTTRTMNDVRDALLGFAVVNKRLPCPDTTGTGIETISGTACNNAQGNLPWATLGIGATDAWGQPFLYRVTLAFANPSATITLASNPDIRICQSAGCTSTQNVVAVVVSKGKNQGICTAACPDELENSNNDVTFVSRIRSLPGAGNEFDDVLVWIPAATLFTRMIAANLLP